MGAFYKDSNTTNRTRSRYVNNLKKKKKPPIKYHITKLMYKKVQKVYINKLPHQLQVNHMTRTKKMHTFLTVFAGF